MLAYVHYVWEKVYVCMYVCMYVRTYVSVYVLIQDVQIFHDHCMDPALSIRKQALSSLNSLTIDAPTCTIMHKLV